MKPYRRRKDFKKCQVKSNDIDLFMSEYAYNVYFEIAFQPLFFKESALRPMLS